MKAVVSVLCFLLINLSVLGLNYKVLFIGNSYTEVNNLPQIISDIASSMGDTIQFSSYTPGGCTFQQHVTGAASYIQQGDWDYVVLQEQSQLPSFPIGQFMNESYPYAQQLVEMIRQYNPTAKVVFYMTWGRKNGDAQNAPYYPPLATYEGMDSLLYARYMMMAEDNHSWVSPVGYVWHYIRNHYPEIELYSADESHPSWYGSYAAATFYTVFFQKDPMNITYHGSLDEGMVLPILETVKICVFDSLFKWFISDPPTQDTTDITHYSRSNTSIWYNYFNKTIEIETDIIQPYQISLYNLQGSRLCTCDVCQPRFAITLAGISEGCYIVQILSSQLNLSKKILIY